MDIAHEVSNPTRSDKCCCMSDYYLYLSYSLKVLNRATGQIQMSSATSPKTQNLSHDRDFRKPLDTGHNKSNRDLI